MYLHEGVLLVAAWNWQTMVLLTPYFYQSSQEAQCMYANGTLQRARSVSQNGESICKLHAQRNEIKIHC